MFVFFEKAQTSILFDKELVNEFILYTFYFILLAKWQVNLPNEINCN